MLSEDNVWGSFGVHPRSAELWNTGRLAWITLKGLFLYWKC